MFDNSCNFAHVKGTRRKREPQLGLPKHHIQGQKVPRYESNNYENEEMDFLAILEKFKKDILTEMEQRINKMTKPNQLPPTTQHIQQYQFPAQQGSATEEQTRMDTKMDSASEHILESDTKSESTVLID